MAVENNDSATDFFSFVFVCFFCALRPVGNSQRKCNLFASWGDEIRVESNNAFDTCTQTSAGPRTSSTFIAQKSELYNELL